MIHGRYGEYKIQVDGETVIDGGALAVLGIASSGRKAVEAVRARLSVSQTPERGQVRQGV